MASGPCVGQRPDGNTFLCKFCHFQMAISCLRFDLFTPNLGILKSLVCNFLTMWINSCYSHNLQTRTQPFTVWKQATGKIWKHSFISTVRPIVHTDPSRKRSFWKTLFKQKEQINIRLAFLCGQKTVFQTKLLENDNVTTIAWFPCPSVP